jgi:hypothetical protein
MLRITAAISVFAFTSAAAVAMPSFGDWSTPANVETLPTSSTSVNTASIDGCASISSDGLTLAFNSFRSANQQIWLATRSNTSEGFGDPVMLPAPINTPAQEFCPTLARGHRLYFSRSVGAAGTGDLFVSKLGPEGWSQPKSLGPAINSSGMVEESPSFYEDDEGREVMVFSRRPNGAFTGVGGKIYQSVDGAPASLVVGGPNGVSSPGDNRPSVTHDGKAIYWDSLRTGTLGGADIWYATRSGTSVDWGAAVQLSDVSSTGSETRANVGWRGDVLIISSDRAGGEGASDMYITTRDKITGN